MMLDDYVKSLTGVEIHGKSIRLRFGYQGIERRETLKGIKLSKSNLRFAFNKRNAILHEIAIGTFDYLAHFPNSENAKLICSPKHTPTVQEAIEGWQLIKETKVRYKTASNYRNDAINHIFPKFGKRLLDTITYTEIETWRAQDLKHLSNKTINEICIPLRGAFANALADRLIDHNPMSHVQNLEKGTQDNADPFSLMEIEMLSKHQTEQASEQNGFIFACWTGLRISEWLALAWEDVDLDKRKIKVNRSIVKNRYAKPKTKGSQRTVDLLDDAYSALLRQKSLSFNSDPRELNILQEDNRNSQKQALRIIFLDSSTGLPYGDGQNIQAKFFKQFLEENSIRHRGINQARHTYASQLLTKGVAERWIAKQMGHNSISMLEKHYGRWLDTEMPNMAKDVSLLFRTSKSPKERPDDTRLDAK
jgi:integrase